MLHGYLAGESQFLVVTSRRSHLRLTQMPVRGTLCTWFGPALPELWESLWVLGGQNGRGQRVGCSREPSTMGH